MLELIENNVAFDAPKRFADFTQGNVEQFNQNVCYGENGGGKIAEEYTNIHLCQFRNIFKYFIDKSDKAQHGMLLKPEHYPFINRLFGKPSGGLLYVCVFGNTDPTIVFNQECNTVAIQKTIQLWGILPHL